VKIAVLSHAALLANLARDHDAAARAGAQRAIAEAQARGQAVSPAQREAVELAATASVRDQHGRVVRSKLKANPELRQKHFRAVRGARKERWRKLMGGAQ
jgi:hypothetical protein